VDPPHRQPPAEIPPPDDDMFAGITDPAARRSAELRLEADLEVLRSFRYVSGPPLPAPIVVLGGTDDKQPTDLSGWARHTRAGYELRLVRGGHFYHRTNREATHTIIRDALRRFTPD
jgi:surfactin synthase thioesterase subunit